MSILQSHLNNKQIVERQCKDLLQKVNFATPLGGAKTCPEGTVKNLIENVNLAENINFANTP